MKLHGVKVSYQMQRLLKMYICPIVNAKKYQKMNFYCRWAGATDTGAVWKLLLWRQIPP